MNSINLESVCTVSVHSISRCFNRLCAMLYNVIAYYNCI